MLRIYIIYNFGGIITNPLMNIKDLTTEEADRVIGLEARMRGVSRFEVSEQFK